MQNIINMIKGKYLIGSQDVRWLHDRSILFTEDDGIIQKQTEEEFINDYIDFLTDLLEQNKQDNDFKTCLKILDDLKQLYHGLEICKITKRI